MVGSTNTLVGETNYMLVLACNLHFLSGVAKKCEETDMHTEVLYWMDDTCKPHKGNEFFFVLYNYRYMYLCNPDAFLCLFEMKKKRL